MRIIYFEENEKNQWNKFIAENCSESFLQSWEWGEFNCALKRKTWKLAVVKDSLTDSKKSKNTKSQISNPKQIPNLKSQTNPKFQAPNYQLPITNHSLTFVRTPNCQLPIANCQLLAAALIIKHDLPFGRSYLYCPRGPAIGVSSIQYPVSSILDVLFNEIKKIAEKEKAMFLRVDPPVSCWFHSVRPAGGPVELECKACAKGFTVPRRELWSQHGGNLKSQQAPHRSMEPTALSSLKKSPNEVQPKDTLILDITKSEEELLKEMKQKTRYNIRLAERKGVKVSSIKYQVSSKYQIPNTEQTPNPKFQTPNKPQIPNSKYFDGFWELMEETSRRDKFASHSKDYYWKMLEGLGESEGDIPECRLRARLYLAEYKNKIIAANIVLYFGDLAVYLHGASSGEYRNVMAPYLLQWRQILDAKKAGCKKYDFWGISDKSQIPNLKPQINPKSQIPNKPKSQITNYKIQTNSKLQLWGVSPLQATFRNVACGLRSINKKSDWQGITRFKKGFGGEEKNYIGAYDAVFDKVGYAAYRSIKSIKYLVSSIKY